MRSTQCPTALMRRQTVATRQTGKEARLNFQSLFEHMQGATKSFHLLRYFSIASLLSIVAATVVLTIYSTSASVRDLREMGEHLNVDKAIMMSNTFGKRLVEFRDVIAPLPADEIRKHPLNTALDADMKRMMRGHDVVKVKIYDLTGKTIYSSDPSQIGEDKRDNQGFIAARNGAPTTELTHRDSFSAFESVIEDRDVLSSYVPIRFSDSGPVEGVFEIYEDVTGFLTRISHARTEVVSVVSGVLILLYLVLFVIVQYADRVLRRQANEIQDASTSLRRANEVLEQRVAERTVELEATNSSLRVTMARHLAVTQSATDAIVTLDAEGTIVGWNPAATRIFGHPEAEVLGKTMTKMMPERYRARHQSGVARFASGGQPRLLSRTTEMHGLTQAGIEFPMELSLSHWRTAEGGLFYSGIIRDISERKQAEEELRSAEERFRGLVEQSIAGIYIIQDVKLAYVNQRFAEIFGYASADELIGQDPLVIVADKDRGLVEANIRQRLEGGLNTLSYGFTAKCKDGSFIEAGLNSSRANYRGRPAIIGMMQDITDKKQTEDKIQRYVAQLETAFRSTVEVATTLSELRDPYTAGHERRVGELAAVIGAEMGFDADRQEGLRVAGHLHDVGKMTIPAEILSKPGKLGAIEFQLIKAHAQASYDVLKAVKWSWPIAEVALQHHERMDGSGYPQGLKGDAILIEARILSVADVVEAMASHRPYRPGLGINAALAEIERGRGTAYDSAATDACLKLFREKGYAIPA